MTDKKQEEQVAREARRKASMAQTQQLTRQQQLHLSTSTPQATTTTTNRKSSLQQRPLRYRTAPVSEQQFAASIQNLAPNLVAQRALVAQQALPLSRRSQQLQHVQGAIQAIHQAQREPTFVTATSHHQLIDKNGGIAIAIPPRRPQHHPAAYAGGPQHAIGQGPTSTSPTSQQQNRYLKGNQAPIVGAMSAKLESGNAATQAAIESNNRYAWARLAKARAAQAAAVAANQDQAELGAAQASSKFQYHFSSPFSASRVLIVNPMQIVNLSEHTKSRLIKIIEALKRFSEKWFSHVLLLMFLAVYACLGAYVFISFEANTEQWEKQNIIDFREKIVNETYSESQAKTREDFTQMLVTRLEHYERLLARACQSGMTSSSLENQWTFWGALFYSMTVFTTIGYGHLTPITFAGRVATMIYAIFGIPILLMVLADLGKLLTRIIKYAFKQFRNLYNKCMNRKSSVRTRKMISDNTSQYIGVARDAFDNWSERVMTRAGSFKHLSMSATGRQSLYERRQRRLLQQMNGGGDDDLDELEAAARLRQPSLLFDPLKTHLSLELEANKHEGDDLVASDVIVTPPVQSEPVSPIISHQQQQHNNRHNKSHHKQQKQAGNNSSKQTCRKTSTTSSTASSGTAKKSLGAAVTSAVAKGNVRSGSTSEHQAIKQADQNTDINDKILDNENDATDKQQQQMPFSDTADPLLMNPSDQDEMIRAAGLTEDVCYEDLDLDGQIEGVAEGEGEGDEEEEEEDLDIPVSFALFLLVTYMMFGAVVFSIWEGWNFFDSLYFVFISMSTIGFGDLVPQHPKRMIGTFIYLLFGLALTSMCINVVQERIHSTFLRAKMQIGEKMGLDLDQIMADDYYHNQGLSESELAECYEQDEQMDPATGACGINGESGSTSSAVAVSNNQLEQSSSNNELVSAAAVAPPTPSKSQLRHQNSVKSSSSGSGANKQKKSIAGQTSQSFWRKSSKKGANHSQSRNASPRPAAPAAATTTAASVSAGTTKFGPAAAGPTMVGHDDSKFQDTASAVTTVLPSGQVNPAPPTNIIPATPTPTPSPNAIVEASDMQSQLNPLGQFLSASNSTANQAAQTDENHDNEGDINSKKAILADEARKSRPRLTSTQSQPSDLRLTRNASAGSTTNAFETLIRPQNSSAASSESSTRRGSVSLELSQLDELIQVLKSPSAAGRFGPLLGIPTRSSSTAGSPKTSSQGMNRRAYSTISRSGRNPASSPVMSRHSASPRPGGDSSVNQTRPLINQIAGSKSSQTLQARASICYPPSSSQSFLASISRISAPSNATNGRTSKQNKNPKPQQRDPNAVLDEAIKAIQSAVM